MHQGPEKKDEVYGYQTLHREIGYYIARLEHYERSLKFFDKSVEKTPQDRRALIGRSISRAKSTQYAGALADINKALQADPDDLSILAQKANNTYLYCEFEEALTQNSRLAPLRQKPEDFTLGVMQCTDAIENCVGERAGHPLRDHFKIIRKLAWKKNAEAQRPFEPKPKNKTKKKSKKKERIVMQKPMQEDSRMDALKPRRASARTIHAKMVTEISSDMKIRNSLTDHTADEIKVPPLPQPYPFEPIQRYTTNIENYMAEKYLGSMYLDKVFLKKIQTTHGITCPNKKGAKKLKQIAKNGFKAVAYKQEVMRTRRPFYFIKYQEARLSVNLQDRQSRDLEQQRKMTKREADGILTKLIDAYNHKQIKTILEISEKLKQFCDSKSRKLLPDKDIYVANIADKVCKGFFETYRVDDKKNEYMQEKQICLRLGMKPSVEVSLESVLEDFENMVVDYKKQIVLFEKRLEDATTPEEACWCYHELTRFNMELKRFDIARIYAMKCIQEAKRLGNTRWIINCYMLLVKVNVQQHNKTDANNELKEAMKTARQMKDQKLENFLKKCQSVLEDTDFEDVFGPKVIEKREAKMINIMTTEEMKLEIRHLFRQMSAMPTRRRMTIMPGVQTRDNPNQRMSRGTKRMSIMPTQKTDDFDDDDDGASRRGRKSTADTQGDFREMIQFQL